jgi:hypothetical protein
LVGAAAVSGKVSALLAFIWEAVRSQVRSQVRTEKAVVEANAEIKARADALVAKAVVTTQVDSGMEFSDQYARARYERF